MYNNSKLSFLKWAGGKRRLVNTLDKLTPNNIERYFEPFLGSGVFFFYLIQTRKKFKAILSDSNFELINAYKIVRDNVDDLIELLLEHQTRYSNGKAKYYYFIRDEYIPKSCTELAAKFIFLNKTCYNGLYRVNRSGTFNVPHGKYVNPKICNIEKLSKCSELLRISDAEIICDSYKRILLKCERDDFIYLDPPYFPLSKTSNFTDYTKESFGIFEHNELAKEFETLNKKGTKVILSNSNSNYIRQLYKEFEIIKIKSLRNINCNAYNRKGHYDLIISNYNKKNEDENARINMDNIPKPTISNLPDQVR
ncbi:MAG: Dam family site-specific DNA-(adenine-N6)-methyltransferase [Thermoproteota archaeon]|nr:Dam family site-specific DNA-(adenine-N6)-methyltransferase [Thermoproteota archaeon]